MTRYPDDEEDGGEDEGLGYDWSGNRAEPGHFVTDGHMMIDTDHLLDPAAMTRFRHRMVGLPVSQEKVAQVLRDNLLTPSVALEVGGLFEGVGWDHLALRRADGECAYVNAEKWVLAKGATGFDRAVQHGGPLMALALYRGDVLVGLLMPVRPGSVTGPKIWPPVSDETQGGGK